MLKPVRLALFAWLGLLVAPPIALAQSAASVPPILDVHLHALAADDQGPPPLAMCTPFTPMPRWDQTEAFEQAFLSWFKHPACPDPVWSPMTDDEVMTKTLDIMKRRNVIGVVSGGYAKVMKWKAKAPDRVLPGLLPDMPPKDSLTKEVAAAKAAGNIAVIGELGLQYDGIAPNDPKMEPIWKAAEVNDVPVAIHIGPGPIGVAYLPGSGYRARLSNPLLMEDVLLKHPRMRVNIMHAGFPMLDETLALLYAHPQVYVDTGVIVYTQPRPIFYRYLKGLVDAGFEDRILFGSDQMVWPETLERAIAVINEAPFLTEAQKRDILYNNAARFLRLDEATRAKHVAMGK